MPTHLEDIGTNIRFGDSTYSCKYISLPTKIGNVRKNIYNTNYNNTSNLSESDFSLVRLKEEENIVLTNG